MDWTQIGGILAAIVALAVVARLLKLGESRIDSAEKARDLAEHLLAGFVAGRAIVSENGRAALIAGNGTVAVLKRQGAKVAACRLVAPLRVREAVEGVTVDTGERQLGAVTLTGVLVDDVRALEAVVGPLLHSVH